mmetsp:Transcript_11309/g.20070  ORF Transcript_11309/g.20070 Transcript_11309/m.20070 type:complete len:290 (+) Transcript_11309:56-925(+)
MKVVSSLRGLGRVRSKMLPPRCRAFCEAAKETPEDIPKEDVPPEAGPRQLFSAKPLTKLASDAESTLSVSAMCSAGGLGAALLGVAPFTPPNPFMIGLLISVVQVQLAHAWMLRQLFVQQRRHVLEVIEEIKDGETVVTVKCDGGVTRHLKLDADAASGSKPSLEDIATKGSSFIFLDRKAGEVHEALDTLLQSDRGVASEEVQVTSISGESEDESRTLVQKFTDLTREHLKKIDGKEGPPPREAIEGITRSAKLTGYVFLFGGSLLGAACRQAGDRPPAVPAEASKRS